MNRSSFKILFFVKRTKPNKDGSLPIYARITVNSKRAEFVLQRTVLDSLWDSSFGCAKGNTKAAKLINDYLEIIKSRIKEAKQFLEERNVTITAYAVKEKYLGKDVSSKTILQLFKEHNLKCKELMNIDFAPGTVERYETCLKHTAEFIRYQYKRDDLLLNEITPQFIADYEFYFKTTKHCSHNTTVKYIKNFKKIVKIAIANGWIKSDPFQNMRFHLKDVDLAYLTEGELKAIIAKEFKIERLQHIKDIYLFCCFTGLAFIDIKKLTHENIAPDKDGKLWIRTKRQKTKNWCHIPLLPPAEQILNKYKNNPICLKNETVLPVPSNQKMNAYLKEIADVCSINKSLSTHTARHTFATTVTLLNKVSIEVVSKMLGHSSINMTKKYARVVDDLIKNDMEKVFNIFA